jgi:3-mercaptopropionate dioxygenase
MNAVSTPVIGNLAPLREFVSAFAALIDQGGDAPGIRARGAPLLRELVRRDDWLPEVYARPDAIRYRQYLLHCDSRERFSIVSFVWGAGQMTPIHDHRVWGLVGVLRGAELVESFTRAADGTLTTCGDETRLEPGDVDCFGPDLGDIHRVANAFEDRTSISIHVYGANIGAVERATYDLTGQAKRFISGYANRTLPNLWDAPQ